MRRVHVQALDGLRGLAVAGVLLFHADRTLIGGYLGVDLFFVLSGYLITGILLSEHAREGRISLANFWVRRARRLLPALLSLLVAVAAYARFFSKPDELRGVRADALATLAYVANWRAIYGHKSYWEIFASASPLEHTWSLAIEEQFYVLWPLLVVAVLLLRRGSRRAMLVVCAALAAASALATLLLYTAENASRVYMGTDTRAVGLLAGAALACVLPMSSELPRSAARAFDALGIAAFVGLAFAWTRLEGESPFLYRGGLWLTEIAAVVLITCAVAAREGIVARALSFAPLRGLGAISYGVYLWHWPVDVVLTPERTHFGHVALTLLRFAVTFAIAIPSYRFFERPIRERGIFFAPARFVVPGSFVATAALALVGTSVWRRPVPPPAFPPPPVAVNGSTKIPGPYDTDIKMLPVADALRPDTMRVLLVGDSVSQFLGLQLRHQQEKQHAFVASRGVGACSIFPAENRMVDGVLIEGTCCADTWDKDVAELRPDVTLVVLGGGYLGTHTCERDWRDRYEARLLYLLESMRADGGRIVVARVPDPMGRWRTKDMHQRVTCFNTSLAAVATKFGADMLDLETHVCPSTADGSDPPCNMFSDGEAIRPDGLHFDGIGSIEVATWTLTELARIRKLPARAAAPALD
jgi:peptidoglycan/LPS O-acetylase OafA/YrhL